MTTPSGLVALTCRLSGSEDRTTAREWYRQASSGFGRPRNRSVPVCWIGQGLPWQGSTRWTSPPKAVAMAWCPRQTPKIGIWPDRRWTRATDWPAVSGRPGPGETTSAEGGLRPSVSISICSLRSTETSWPRVWKACARFHTKESLLSRRRRVLKARNPNVRARLGQERLEGCFAALCAHA